MKLSMNYAIIAAGEGSRLVEEGVSIPKPLIPINGEPMIDRLLRIFVENKAKSISVIVNEEMVEVRNHLEALKLPVPFHLKVKTTLSSMHSFYELSPELGAGKFCMTTVDTMFREDEFSRYIETFEQDRVSDGLMGITSFIDDEKPLYISVGPNDMITGFWDFPTAGQEYVSGGIYGLTPASIPVLRRALSSGTARMRNYQRELIRAGLNIRAYPFSKIIDVDHACDIEKAAAFVKKR